MPQSIRLEVFEARAREADQPSAAVDAETLEEARLTAFEQGYQAGWDDAASAQDQDQTKLRADIANNMQALAFTYEEARAHLLKGLAPLLEQICAQVVPAISAAAIGEIVREALAEHVEAAATGPVEIVLNPASRSQVESALAGGATPPYTLTEEPTLGAGQVLLRLDEDTTRQFDLDAAVAEISAAVAAFFTAATSAEDPEANREAETNG